MALLVRLVIEDKKPGAKRGGQHNPRLTRKTSLVGYYSSSIGKPETSPLSRLALAKSSLDTFSIFGDCLLDSYVSSRTISGQIKIDGFFPL